MLVTSLFAAAALTGQPIVAPGSIARSPSILVLEPGEVRCAGEIVQPVRAERPLPVEMTHFVVRTTIDPTILLRFHIDASGRPVSISAPIPEAGIAAQARDLVPAFSVWRFRPGAARQDCQVSFAANVVPAASAPLEEIHRLLILARPSRVLRRAVLDRLEGPGSTCFNPGPSIRRRVYPAFERIEQAPGTTSYSLVGFDIAADGRPINVRLADSAGNAELDRQSLNAIRRSRFAPEAKQGCTYPYWRRATDKIAAPPVLGLQAFRRPGDTCSPEGAKWAQLPRLVFPPEFVRRGVEGWAIVRYDIAPWGQTGNINVVAAEPAARFGTQAETIVRSARGEPSSTGATGCVDRVIFRLPDPGERPPSDADEN